MNINSEGIQQPRELDTPKAEVAEAQCYSSLKKIEVNKYLQNIGKKEFWSKY